MSNFSIKIDIAIKKGMDFVKKKQCNDGLWRDFKTLAGASSEWLSGLVAYAISSGGYQKEIISPTLKELLKRQRDNGGWSYNSIVPTDCDSTTWVMLALSRFPISNQYAIKKAINYIEFHYNKHSEGFSTYNIHDGIHKFIRATPEDIDGWTSVHSDITSVAILCMQIYGCSLYKEIIRKSLSFLKMQKNENNLWDSYWWKGYAYGTFNALKALIAYQYITKEEVAKTLRTIMTNQQKDGGWNDSSCKVSEVFETAFMILSLLLLQTTKTISSAKGGIVWLIDHQDNDGGWPTTPILKIPPPMVKNPDTIEKWKNNKLGTRVIIEDSKRILSSSVSIWALIEFNTLYKTLE